MHLSPELGFGSQGKRGGGQLNLVEPSGKNPKGVAPNVTFTVLLLTKVNAQLGAEPLQVHLQEAAERLGAGRAFPLRALGGFLGEAGMRGWRSGSLRENW